MIQRGSVMDMPRYPGDPSRPIARRAGRRALPMDRSKRCRHVVRPLSYRDGIELLKRLKGPVAPEVARRAADHLPHRSPGESTSSCR
jgi:N-acetylated-alpha-linked acidic dipeptidase